MNKPAPMCDAVVISVDCEANDSIDVNYGGPKFLGFDFYVRIEEKDEMITFVKDELAKNRIPCLRVYTAFKELQTRHLWNKEKISKAIANGYG